MKHRLIFITAWLVLSFLTALWNAAHAQTPSVEVDVPKDLTRQTLNKFLDSIPWNTLLPMVDNTVQSASVLKIAVVLTKTDKGFYFKVSVTRKDGTVENRYFYTDKSPVPGEKWVLRQLSKDTTPSTDDAFRIVLQYGRNPRTEPELPLPVVSFISTALAGGLLGRRRRQGI